MLALLGCTAPTHGEAGLHTLAGGTYRVALPPSWDGKTRLPLVLYLHGYGQDSAHVMDDRALVAAVTGSGALLAAPDGLRYSWSFAGSPSQGARDEIAFLRAVVADAKQRWPIDESQVIAAGFSIGGSVVWDLACHAADGFAAFLPVSGGFWLPYPESCDSGPVNLRHIHGTNDGTVPLGGRTIRGRFNQGDIGVGFEIFKRTDACREEAARIEQQGELKCWIWSSCAGGHELQMCLHPDGHEIKPEWLKDGIAWARGLRAGR
jgi:polyhydroxybutyrate depolymerase